MAIAQSAQNPAVHGVLQDCLAGYADHCFHLGHVDVLTFAGALSIVESGQDRKRSVKRAIDVGIGLLEAQNPFAVIANHVIDSCEASERWSVRLGIAQRAVLPRSGQGDHDNAGFDFDQRLIVQAVRLHNPRRKIFDDYITYPDQLLEYRYGLWFSHINGYAQLIADSTVEPGVSVWVSVEIVGAEPHGVDTAPCLDLYHFSAEVTQHAGQVRTGKHPTEVDHTIALEGKRFARAQMIPPLCSSANSSLVYPKRWQ